MPTFDYEAARKAGASEQEIADFLAQNQHLQSTEEQMESAGSGKSSAFGNALMRGAIIGAGLPGNLESLGLSGGNWLAQKGIIPQALIAGDSGRTLFPTSQELLDFAAQHGIQTKEVEGLGPKMAEGAISAVPAALLTGGVSALPGALGAGAAAEATTEGVNKFFPNAPEGLKLSAGIIGGMLGARGGTMAQREVNSLLGNLNPVAQKVSTAGLPLESPALTAENARTRATFAPFTDINNIKQDIGNVIENHAAEMSPSRTWEDAGMALQSSLRDWKNNTLPRKLAEQGDLISSVVPQGAQVDMKPFMKTLEDMTQEAGALQPLQNTLVPKLPAALRDSLNKVFEGQKTGTVPPVSWDDVKNVRSAIGDVIGSAKDYGITEKQANKLYASLSNVMRSTIKNGEAEKDAVNVFDSANAEMKRLYDFRQQIADKIVAEGKEPGAIASKFISDGKWGGTRLNELFNEVPDTKAPLAAVALRQHGLENPSDIASSAADNFSKRWQGGGTSAALSPEAKSELFGPQARKLDALASVHDNVLKLPSVKSGDEWGNRVVAAILGGAGAQLLGSHQGIGELGHGLGEAIGVGASISREAALRRLANSPQVGKLMAGAGPSANALGPLANPLFALQGVNASDLNAPSQTPR